MRNFEPHKIVVIGASTGGPGQIEKIITALERLHDTTLIIAQHMAVDFIPSFVKRLQQYSKSQVSLALHDEQMQTGTIYICSGITTLRREGYRAYFSVSASLENRYNPDIDSIFGSLVPFSDEIKILGVILTGIGDDGVNGCKELSLRGASVMTQDAKSSIVDGMPSRARKEIDGIMVGNIEEIREKIKEFCS